MTRRLIIQLRRFCKGIRTAYRQHRGRASIGRARGPDGSDEGTTTSIDTHPVESNVVVVLCRCASVYATQRPNKQLFASLLVFVFVWVVRRWPLEEHANDGASGQITSEMKVYCAKSSRKMRRTGIPSFSFAAVCPRPLRAVNGRAARIRAICAR